MFQLFIIKDELENIFSEVGKDEKDSSSGSSYGGCGVFPVRRGGRRQG
jgi:hypothetical protein